MDPTLTLLLFQLLLAALILRWADAWGRHKWRFFCGALLSPLIAAIVLLIVGKKKENTDD